ncbi:MAG: N-6 DNA methylase [Ignavibacteria bacterium]|nr:N-6 DNA methylase [Ignavibacteria bacterium]
MVTKESAYKKIAELVQRFEEQYASYKNSDYNETLTRRDFIDPFFKALGWDMDNEQGYAESFREVKHEDKLKIGNAVKAPDYSFRANSDKKLFFVEAKKPSVVIKEDIHPAYQVRRYGWSGKLAISIVTDFEEFAIYDCTKKPLKTDKASVARMKYLTFRDYLNEFDFLWDTLARISVLRGSLDKYVQGTANKRGAETVDKDFLKTLDGWRTYLATSLSRDNKELNEEEINFAVQQTIDRIIFLRIAEGRKVEPEGNLQTAIQQGDYYQNLFSLFKEADDKYNSGLFDFKKDTISKNLKIDNKVIKTIISELYVPKSQYEFSELSVEILGSAYEQFLGKVIRITPAHHAKIEEKPEVRKAGGVYYTPEYIVEYIVKNTVGKLVEGKTPKEISKIKIVDPACGSGSFLIGAYNYLLNYHKNYYSNNGKPAKGRKEDTLTPEGHLTTAEKKRILLNNIYGVDIDVNAVEVTKLSLLLKCLEGETEASIAHQLSMFHERVLPTLENNIKSGNSLVSTDIYENELFEVDKKTKPFNWEKEFPEVFSVKNSEVEKPTSIENLKKALRKSVEAEKELNEAMRNYITTVKEPFIQYGLQSGFDIVIGNPPWGADLSEEVLFYLRIKHSSIIVRMIDSYMYFIKHSIDLLKIDGSFGMIIPSTFLNQSDMQLLRKLIAEELNLQVVINLGEKIFGPKVLNTSTILVFTKSLLKDKEIVVADIREYNPDDKGNALNEISLSQKDQWLELVKADPQTTYFTFNTSNVALLNKLKKKFTPFSEIVEGEIQRGISPDYAKAFVISSKEAASKKIERKILKPLVLGKHISRYSSIHTDEFILYLTSKDNIALYPNAKAHLSEFKKFITCREVAEGKHPWYALHRPRNPEIFSVKKFIGLTTTKKLCLVYDDEGYYTTDALYVFKTKAGINEKAILAILHSKVFQFLYDTAIQGGQRVIPQVKAVFLNALPFPNIEKSQTEIIKLVDQLLKLNEEKANTKLQSEIEQIQRHINFCDDQINAKVYELYGLEQPEIDIIEANAKK